MKNFKIEIKWAIIFSIATLLWMFLEKLIGLHNELIAKQAIYTNLFGVIAIVLYLFAIKEKKKNFFNGIINWKQGFISGIILSVFIAILSPLTQYIISTYISPEYFNNIIAFVVENGKMNLENAQAYFNLKSYMLQSAFGTLTMGIVTSAVIAYFIKHKS